MNENETSNKIIGYLDHSTAELKPGAAYKLQLARQHALSRLSEPDVAAQLTLAGTAGRAMSGGSFGRGRRILDARVWIGILLVVASVLYYQYWQSASRARDIEETDAAILTSELPIEAYLDRGFLNWLAHSEP
jgi:hypothetical protein